MTDTRHVRHIRLDEMAQQGASIEQLMAELERRKQAAMPDPMRQPQAVGRDQGAVPVGMDEAPLPQMGQVPEMPQMGAMKQPITAPPPLEIPQATEQPYAPVRAMRPPPPRPTSREEIVKALVAPAERSAPPAQPKVARNTDINHAATPQGGFDPIVQALRDIPQGQRLTGPSLPEMPGQPRQFDMEMGAGNDPAPLDPSFLNASRNINGGGQPAFQALMDQPGGGGSVPRFEQSVINPLSGDINAIMQMPTEQLMAEVMKMPPDAARAYLETLQGHGQMRVQVLQQKHPGLIEALMQKAGV